MEVSGNMKRIGLNIIGIKIDTFADLQREVEMVVGGIANLEIERSGEIITLPVKLRPIEIEENGEEKKKVLLGVRSITVSMCDYHGMPLWESLKAAVDETLVMTTTTLRGVGQMITGQRSGQDVGGVIRIAEMTGDISKQHSVVSFLMFMALLSVNLGLINLFPIPVLDGGQVVISFVEMIIRRELNDKVKEYMKENPDFTQMLYDMIMNKIKEAKNAASNKNEQSESEQ